MDTYYFSAETEDSDDTRDSDCDIEIIVEQLYDLGVNGVLKNMFETLSKKYPKLGTAHDCWDSYYKLVSRQIRGVSPVEPVDSDLISEMLNPPSPCEVGVYDIDKIIFGIETGQIYLEEKEGEVGSPLFVEEEETKDDVEDSTNHTMDIMEEVDNDLYEEVAEKVTKPVKKVTVYKSYISDMATRIMGNDTTITNRNVARKMAKEMWGTSDEKFALDLQKQNEKEAKQAERKAIREAKKASKRSEEKVYACKLCKKPFKTHYALGGHCASIHPKKKSSDKQPKRALTPYQNYLNKRADMIQADNPELSRIMARTEARNLWKMCNLYEDEEEKIRHLLM